MIKFLKNNIKLFLISVAIAMLILFIADYYLHYKLEQAYNTEGYRGEIKEEKKAGEYRVACFGGSTTFGYGVASNETWPFYLEQDLGKNISVVNLGMNGQGIFGISDDIKNYDYLNYDLAIICDGYNDRDPLTFNEYSPREEDFFFRNFGYKIILPLYLKEKFEMLFSNDEKVIFNGGESQQTKTNTDKYFYAQDSIANAMEESGKPVFSDYLSTLKNVLNSLTQKGKTIVYVCQPECYTTTQQKKVRKLINKEFPKVLYLNCSEAIDLKQLAYDGLHLSANGNKIFAKAIADSLTFHKLIH